jgi:hypothetical protein
MQNHQAIFYVVLPKGFTEVFKSELTPDQLNEIEKVISKNSVLDRVTFIQLLSGTIHEFGENVASNILAKLITNPIILSEIN